MTFFNADLRKYRIKLLILFFISLAILPLLSFSQDSEEEKFSIARNAYDDSFYEASSLLFNNFIREFPQSVKIPQAQIYIAKCFYYRQNYDKSLDILNQIIINDNAKNIADEAYYFIANIYFRQKKINECLKIIQELIDKYNYSSNYWPAYYLGALCHLALNNKNEAINVFIKIINESKDKNVLADCYNDLLNIYLQDNSSEKVIDLTTQYLISFPKGILAAKMYLYQAQKYYSDKNFSGAIISFSGVLKTTTDLSLLDLAYQGLTFSHLAVGNLKEAQKVLAKIKDEQLGLVTWATYFFTTKNYTAVINTVADFLKKFPKSEFTGKIYLTKADSFYEMGRINDAAAVYEMILGKFNDEKNQDTINKAHYGLAWCYLKNADFKKAIKEFSITLKYTDNPLVKESSQIQIADTYLNNNQYAEALAIYDAVLLNSSDTVYGEYVYFQKMQGLLKANDLKKAEEWFSDFKKRYPASKFIAKSQYDLATKYVSTGDYLTAEKLLKDFIAAFPGNEIYPKAYYFYGKCLFEQKKYESVLNIFEDILSKIRLYGKEIEELVMVDLGNVYINLSLPEKAKKAWSDFLVKFPYSKYSSLVGIYLGNIYEGEDNYLEAEKYYNNILLNFSGSSQAQEAILSLGRIYWVKNNLDKAKEYFSKISEGDKSLNYQAKLYLAKIHQKQGDGNMALTIYDYLIEHPSEVTTEALLAKGYFLKENKDYPNAIIFLNKAIAARLDSPQLRFYLGFCLEKSNRYDEAIKEYQEVVNRFTNSEYKIKAYFRIAKIYEMNKNIDAAKQIYRKIIGFNTEESRVAQVRLTDLDAKASNKRKARQ